MHKDIKDFKTQRRGRHRKLQKKKTTTTTTTITTTGFISKKTTRTCITLVFTFLCPFLHDYNVKMPNFAFYGVRKEATTNLASLSELEYGPYEFTLTPEGFARI